MISSLKWDKVTLMKSIPHLICYVNLDSKSILAFSNSIGIKSIFKLGYFGDYYIIYNASLIIVASYN